MAGERSGSRKAARRTGTPDDAAKLARYREKRNFEITPEPAGEIGRAAGTPGARGGKPARQSLSFVIQKHWASHLHYDFRLELDGVMLSWAVPKGPSLDPGRKHLAVRVEDHPISYNSFEGTIPKGQYGAGKVIVWDRGTWEPVGDARQGLQAGKLKFVLHGEKLGGLWDLIRTSGHGSARPEQWLLRKSSHDEWARPDSEYDVLSARPESVIARSSGPVEAADTPKPLDSTRSPKTSTARKATKPQAAHLPQRLAPQLASLVDAPPPGPWLLESKFDGYRILARIADGQARLFTRTGLDWTDKLEPLAGALAALQTVAAWLDGEIVVLNAHGVPEFNLLQNALDAPRSAGIVYFLFDAPFLDGRDLRDRPLTERRAALESLIGKPSANASIRLSQSFEAPVEELLRAACETGLEGLILKRPDARYESSRSTTWLKLKCTLRQEFVVVGFTDRANAPDEVGALLLAVHDDAGRLQFAGAVGTGWNAATRRRLHARLVRQQVAAPPVDVRRISPGRWSRRPAGAERWVTPSMVVEVEFAQWTPEGRVRHARYVGERMDKPVQDIVRETPRSTPRPLSAKASRSKPDTSDPKRSDPRSQNPSANEVAGILISHPDRVIDRSSGLRKLDLARYYARIADWILPHLKGRPVALLRAPQGLNAPTFFQKHADTRVPGVKELAPKLSPGEAPLLEIDSTHALVSAAQMNVIELHTWNSTTRSIDKPDRIVFDLDPGEGVGWPLVQEGALLVRTMLTELGLQSWLKTSGGKGLHVIVPIAARLDDDTVKALSRAIVEHLAATIPQRFVAQPGPAKRRGKIFVDYLRNGRGQTTVSAYSARARPGLGVSMPIAWDQLAFIEHNAQWTIATAPDYLAAREDDPWADYWTCRQTLTRARRLLATTRSG